MRLSNLLIVSSLLFLFSCEPTETVTTVRTGTPTILDLQPTPAVRPSPTPSTGKVTEFNPQKIIAFVHDEMASVMAESSQSNPQNVSLKMEQSMLHCSFDHRGPLCFDMEVEHYAEAVMETPLLYMSHFRANETQYLMVAPLRSLLQPEFRHVDLFVVDQLFTMPASEEDINQLAFHSRYHLSDDVDSLIETRLLETTNVDTLYYSMEMIRRREGGAISEPTGDWLLEILHSKLTEIDFEGEGELKELIEFAFNNLKADIAPWIPALENSTFTSIRELGQLLSAPQIELAFFALDSDWWITRHHAITYLTNMELSEREEARLLLALEDENEDVARLIYNWGQTLNYSYRHWTSFSELMQSDHYKTREFSVFLIGRSHTRDSVELLLEHLNDPSDTLGEHIFEQLESMAADPDLLPRFPRTIMSHFESTRWQVRYLAAKLIRYAPSRRTLDGVITQINIEANLRVPETKNILQIQLQESKRAIEDFLNAPD